MGKIKFLKGTGAFPTSGLKTEALYFSVPDNNKFEIGIATSATTLALLNANSANKLTLTSAVGSSKRPVYFTATGVPNPIDYTIEKSVPANADFTNTAHGHGVGVGLVFSGTGGVSGTAIYSANLASETSLGTIGTTARLYAVGVDANGKLCAYIPWTDTIVSKLRLTANAADDDVVILEGEGGDNTVSYTVSHAQKGPASGYTSGNTTTSIVGNAATGTIKVPQITVDKYGHVTAAADENITITMPTLPTALKNPYGLTVQGNGTTIFTYDGSAAQTVNLKAGSNVSISTATNGTITISSSYTNTTYSQATESTLGLVKIGFTESGKNYPVELNSSGQMYVNVPWTDNNTHYTTYLYATSSNGTANAATTNGNTYLRLFDNTTARSSINIKGTGATTVTSDNAGIITINSTNTTYAQATGDTLGLVKIGFTESGKNYPVELNGNGQMFVNVPWENTNTDTKVTSAKSNTTKAYITGTTKAQTGTLIFDEGIYLDTTAGMLTATTFKGALQGNADTATWADTADTQELDVISNKIATTQWVHDYIVSLLYDGAIQ